MDHLIRNTATREYFTHGNWTSDIARAQKFPNPLSAISFSLQNKLKDAELVVLPGTGLSTKEVRLPLPAQ